MSTTDPTTLEPAVAYYRVSKSEMRAGMAGADQVSIQHQGERVPAHFAGKYRIVEVYIDEGKSGSKDTRKRAAFLRMVRDLTEGKHRGRVRTVVCLDLARFGRLDTITGAEHKGALRAARVRLDTIADGPINWGTAAGRIIDSVRSEGNHETSLTIARKGLAGRIRVTRAGRPNQTTPYGMAKRVTTPSGEQITVPRRQRFSTPKSWASVFVPGEPAEAEAVGFAFDTFDRRDLSYLQLAALLTEKGFPSPTGVGWQGETVSLMLRNVLYAGDLQIGAGPKGEFFRVHGEQETAVGDLPEEGARATPVYARGVHEAIIPRDLFDRVQAKILRKTKSRGTPRRAGPYALTGVILCGKCGRPMYGAKNERGLTIYRCHRQEVDASSACGYWIAYEPDILPFLFRRALPDIRAEVAALRSRPEPAPGDGEADRLRARLAALERDLGAGRARFLTAPAGLAAGLQNMLERWEAERADLLGRIEALSGPAGADLSGLWTSVLDREGVVAVPQPEVDFHGVRVTPLSPLPAGEFREVLKKLGASVSVYFRRKPKGGGKGWILDKVRVRAEVGGGLSVCYAGSSNDDPAQHTRHPLLFDRWYGPDDLRPTGT